MYSEMYLFMTGLLGRKHFFYDETKVHNNCGSVSGQVFLYTDDGNRQEFKHDSRFSPSTHIHQPSRVIPKGEQHTGLQWNS